jgi:membrane protein CcdC involved in cytochrome C biogenesis
MRGTDRTTRRRNSLYVKQNKAYQLLLATLLIVFLIVAGVVLATTWEPSATWKDNFLIRMIIERNAARYSQHGQ